jgi:hypothetical protein
MKSKVRNDFFTYSSLALYTAQLKNLKGAWMPAHRMTFQDKTEALDQRRI